MLRGTIISPDAGLAEKLKSFLGDVGHIGIMRTLTAYPNPLELTRLVRANPPQVLFVGLENIETAGALVAAIEAQAPGVQIVAIHRSYDPQIMLEVMRLGIREFLSLPFTRDSFYEMVRRLGDALERRPVAVESTDQLFAFLPAKAGVGASTVALNAAMSMARQTDAEVLLTDFDMNSGMIRFMLKLDSAYSVVDAAENASKLDENLWTPLVSAFGRLDVLHAGKLNPNFRIEPIQIRQILDFARRNYQAICIDLSGNLEKYSLEIMHEAKRVFLVCTPELTSLHLAGEKLHYLKSLDLGDRVSLLVNRSQKRSLISTAQIEELLQIPVQQTFPNDYTGVQRALQDGRAVDPASELGKQFALLAQNMLALGKPVAEYAKEPKKKLAEFFSIVPGRFSIFPENKKTAS